LDDEKSVMIEENKEIFDEWASPTKNSKAASYVEYSHYALE
jgi:hypothetical protein